MADHKTQLVGIGFDVHAWEEIENYDPNQPNYIPICGVPIPFHKKIIAHSDGDVGLHAIIDAILGAAGAGDIGMLFPDKDPKWKNVNSSIFVEKVLEILAKKQMQLINIDVTIICEKPKICNYRTEIKESLSKIFALNIERVNIKATTTEKLGFLGRSDGIAAQAIATVMVM